MSDKAFIARDLGGGRRRFTYCPATGEDPKTLILWEWMTPRQRADAQREFMAGHHDLSIYSCPGRYEPNDDKLVRTVSEHLSLIEDAGSQANFE